MNQELIATLREGFAPEAVEYLELLNAIEVQATQDNYGRVMGLVSSLDRDETKLAFLGALEDAGYPSTTAAMLRSMIGLI